MAAAKKKVRTLATISDEIAAIRRKRAALNKEEKELGKDQGVLELELIAAAQEQGLDKGGGKASKFTMGEVSSPQLKNDTDFFKFVADNNYFHLFTRRLKAEACRELWDKGIDIPGVDKFTQVAVTVTSL